MCRLLLMTGIKDSELAAKFMKAAKIPMSVGNDMGIGYSAVKSNGDFFTERWHDNDMFMDRESVMTPEIIEQLKPFEKRLSKLKINYDFRGELADLAMTDIRTVTMHTRYATCGRDFMNTHPFVYGDTSLVHNGVINNDYSLNVNKISTCDSEAALQTYIQEGVATNFDNAQAWLDRLSGYWAFGILARDSSGRRIFDVVRNSASLYAANVEDLGLVIATTAGIIHSASLQTGLVAETPQLITANMLWRFDAVTGELLQKQQLRDSSLNNSYYSSWGGTTDQYEKVFGTAEVTKLPVSKPVEPVSETYEDVLELWDYVEDTNEPLIDRLDAYDKECNTRFTYMYESLPRDFRSVTWQKEDFFEVLDEIELAHSFYTSGAKGTPKVN